jgi:hypothetical protein
MRTSLLKDVDFPASAPQSVVEAKMEILAKFQTDLFWVVLPTIERV